MDPAKLASVGEAVKVRAAYDQAVASGDPRAIRAAATKLGRFQEAAGPGIHRDRKGGRQWRAGTDRSPLALG